MLTVVNRFSTPAAAGAAFAALSTACSLEPGPPTEAKNVAARSTNKTNGIAATAFTDNRIEVHLPDAYRTEYIGALLLAYDDDADPPTSTRQGLRARLIDAVQQLIGRTEADPVKYVRKRIQEIRLRSPQAIDAASIAGLLEIIDNVTDYMAALTQAGDVGGWLQESLQRKVNFVAEHMRKIQ